MCRLNLELIDKYPDQSNTLGYIWLRERESVKKHVKKIIFLYLVLRYKIYKKK